MVVVSMREARSADFEFAISFPGPVPWVIGAGVELVLMSRPRATSTCLESKLVSLTRVSKGGTTLVTIRG